MPQKVLVVDDDDEIVRVVQLTLEARGYLVDTASNGREVIEYVARAMPDAIVMDVEMPEMDGISALKKLKDNPLTATIPVIMLTAKDQVEDISSGWNFGADFYWTKPFSAVQLGVLLQRILDEKLIP